MASSRIKLDRRLALLLTTLCALLTLPGGVPTVHAHEIPSGVTIRVFLHPQGERLELLVRAPMEAMRDVSWPTRGPGYLELSRIDSVLRDAATLWLIDSIELYEEDLPLTAPEILATRVSLPSDDSFRSFTSARERVTGAQLPDDTQIYWEQGMLDVLFAYPIQSEEGAFSIRPRFSRLGLRVNTVLAFLPPAGSERVFTLQGDPGLVRLDPRWHQAAAHFVRLGFVHILDGIDHLLFLLCLVIPLQRFRSLVLVVTSFSLAHSITLAGAALGLAPTGLWFPSLIEALIALSIAYMALENILGIGLERRWMIAFGFGLVHGFGFSFALQETLQFAGRHLVSSLVSFNIGVELGQLLVISILIPALYALFRFLVAERMGVIILSVLVGHTAWHWMLERGGVLSEYSWPTITAGGLATLLRWTMLAVALAGLAWLASLLRRPRTDGSISEEEPRGRAPSDSVG